MITTFFLVYLASGSYDAAAGLPEPHERLVRGSFLLSSKADVQAAMQRSCTDVASSSSCGTFVIGGGLKITGTELEDEDLAPLLTRVVGVRGSVVVSGTTKLTTLASLQNLENVGIAVKLRDNERLQSACGLAGLVGPHSGGLRIDVYGNRHPIKLPRQLSSELSSAVDPGAVVLASSEDCRGEKEGGWGATTQESTNNPYASQPWSKRVRCVINQRPPPV